MLSEHSRPLEGQRALVTGANSGIGAAVARSLAQAGARTAVRVTNFRPLLIMAL